MIKRISTTLLLPFMFCAQVAYAGAKDDPFLVMGKLDQFEMRDQPGEDPLILNAQLWAGHDLRKFWLKAEGERVDGESEELELQALYSRAISTYWDIQVGLRKDFKPEPDRSWGVIALQGLAPYFFDVDASLFVGESGRTGLRFDAEYELLITQRLVLVPEIELNAYGHNDRETGVGSGLSDVELGVRLQYSIRREFSPYVGLNWNKKYGNSADFASDAGGDIEDMQFVFGFRAWF